MEPSLRSISGPHPIAAAVLMVFGLQFLAFGTAIIWIAPKDVADSGAIAAAGLCYVKGYLSCLLGLRYRSRVQAGSFRELLSPSEWTIAGFGFGIVAVALFVTAVRGWWPAFLATALYGTLGYACFVAARRNTNDREARRMAQANSAAAGNGGPELASTGARRA